MNPLEFTDEIETLYDLTVNLSHDFGSGRIDQDSMPDSRARLDTLIEWANDFNKLHAGREWDGDYIDAVDDFYEEKVKDIKHPLAAVDERIEVSR